VINFVIFDKAGYQLRLFPWQWFTTEKLTTVVTEIGRVKMILFWLKTCIS